MQFKIWRMGALAMGLACAWLPATAQGDADGAHGRKLAFREYAAAVERHNLDLQIQRENVVSAQAGVSIAGVRPDPVLTGGIDSKELYGPNKANAATTTIIGLELTIETGGKRDRRIKAAQATVRAGEATLAGAKRQAYADAAVVFTEACRARDALAYQEATLQSLSDIASANGVRRRVGDIGGLELTQSQVERDRFEADVAIARSQVQSAAETLSIPLGRRYQEVFGDAELECGEPGAPGLEDVTVLVARALEARDDIHMARAALDAARAAAGLAQANRWVDPVISVGVKNTPPVRPTLDAGGAVANSPAERSRSLGFTVSVPIPLSRMQRGEVLQAEALVTQAMLALRTAELKAQTDVRRMHAQYMAAAANVRRYRENLLPNADKVVDGMRLSYKKGAASLLELLSAQRSANDIHLAYLQAAADLTVVTVQLQQATGTDPTGC